MKSARRRAREFAMQGIYQWIMAQHPVAAIEQQLSEVEGFSRADPEFSMKLVRGVIANAPSLEESLKPFIDRPIAELSPVEYAIVLLGALELAHHPEVPYRVVINEGVELAKTFGGTDGHKWVNGVLDKLAPTLRPVESRAPR